MSRRIPLIDDDRNTNTLHAERVSLAHQILSGIPDGQVHLNSFYAAGTEQNICGTIACGAGWLALHPSFQEFGLRPRVVCGQWKGVEFAGLHADNTHIGFHAVFKVFASGDEDADASKRIVDSLFEARSFGGWDDVLLRLLHTGRSTRATDKELLLMRLRYAYQHHCGLRVR